MTARSKPDGRQKPRSSDIFRQLRRAATTSIARTAGGVVLMAGVVFETHSLPTASQLFTFMQSAGCANAAYLNAESSSGAAADGACIVNILVHTSAPHPDADTVARGLAGRR